jgi:hypothetical protein
MITQEFFNLLNENQNKVLNFEYSKDQFVEANYHITEVKNVKIDSVDCGGVKNRWSETVLQLWVASEGDKAPQLTTNKSLEIMNRVDAVDTINRDTELYFEYGNAQINVSNFQVVNIQIETDSITITFAGISTECKAATRAGSICRTPSEESLKSSC